MPRRAHVLRLGPARLLIAVAVAAAVACGAAAPPECPPAATLALGLDHVPVAVNDLEAAAAEYCALGFTLKPGRAHANGLRNAHVKFPDGTGLELITAARAVDPLTTRYRDLLAAGDGPAFLALHASDLDALESALSGGGWACRRERELVEMLHPGLEFLFFVRDNRSPTDRPEHFAHANGATALVEARLALADSAAADLRRLLAGLGGAVRDGDGAIELAAGAILIAPLSEQRLPGRPVVGVTLTVRALLGDADIAPERARGLALRFR